MAEIQHADIGNAHRHEPKGITTAPANSIYKADGSGSGSWQVVSQFTQFSAFPIGTVIPYAGVNAPPGWSFCYGQLVGRVQYSSLFATIGVNYGFGDGATTFALPDCRGRVNVGKDNMGGTAANIMTTAGGVAGTTLGASGGAESVTLTANNIPSLSGTANTAGAHTHTLTNGNNVWIRSNSAFPRTSTATALVGVATITTNITGAHTHNYTVNTGSANTPHVNAQPTLIMPMIIYHGVA